MSSSESEEDIKRTGRQPEPLCLFCYPYDASNCACEEETYLTRAGRATLEKQNRKKWPARKEKQEMWLRRRTEVKRKRRMQEAGRHLKSYLLVSVRPGRDQQYVPCLIEALDTVKDAWPPNKRLSVERFLDGSKTSGKTDKTFTMRDDKPLTLSFYSRRSSMPEDVMRKYVLKKTIPSEESEANQTVPDATSPSSKESPTFLDRERSDFASNQSIKGYNSSEIHTNREHQGLTNVSGASQLNAGGMVKRVTQNDYDKQGKGIIRQKTKERGSQTGRFSGRSDTSPTMKEDTEESRTSESLPSSSPVEMRRQVDDDVSTSGNLSSESEEVKCTCAELTSSKDTSTDLFRSGNSTLSQTVSEKSISTQDSTVSIHSVSTGGSTVSGNSNSNSTSPDFFGKTSAKESSSPERTPRGRSKYGHNILFKRKFMRRYPSFLRKRHFCRRHFRSKRRSIYEISEEKELRDDCSIKENCKAENVSGTPKVAEEAAEETKEKPGTEQCGKTETKYEWTKYTPEEMYMVQQMRHRKFLENFRTFSVPVPATPDTGSLSACAASGSAYKQIEELDDRVLIPRYSALPRTLSMLVNTSSGDTSAINSDSDSLSLVDSLEEFPIVHVHQYDTKKERKPVRGDVSAVTDAKKKIKRKHPRPRAFFVSFKEPFGEDELMSGITKLPEPPDKIKERINERQLHILRLQRENLEKKLEAFKEKKKQRRHAKELRHWNRRNIKTKERNNIRRDGEQGKKEESVNHIIPGKNKVDREKTLTAKRSERAGNQETVSSKTPLPSTSTSTSPEREAQIHRKKKLRKEKVKTDAYFEDRHGKQNTKVSDASDEQTMNVKKNEEVGQVQMNNVAKPQAVIHPSQMPASEQLETETYRRNKHLFISQSRPGKYRQKFEVIPEEKSSSLSSTDEKKTEVKKNTSQKSELGPRRYSLGNASNLVFAKLMGSSLQAMPCVHKGQNSEQPIILVSPKNIDAASSRKGRDALIAMNREDFNRLSKGWMNFYMLKDMNDPSENCVPDDKGEPKLSQLLDKKERRQDKNRIVHGSSKSQDGEPDEDVKTSGFTLSEKPDNHDLTSVNMNNDEVRDTDTKMAETERSQKEVRKSLNDAVRFHSSNTILKPIKATPRKPEKTLSLPELIVPSSSPTVDHQSKNKNSTLVLPKVSQKLLDNDGMDSDSTVYCQPPSFIVPRLSFDGSGDSPSENSSCSSDNDEVGSRGAALPVNHFPLRKRGISQRLRHKRETHHESLNHGSGWSVTVAGTLELNSTTPDLEMRLSFPTNGCAPPQASQSDSGFAEDGPHTIGNSSDVHASEGNMKQRWTVTVTNPKQGDGEGVKRKLGRSHVLPNLGQSQCRNVKKVVKSHGIGNADYHGKISIYWPQVEITKDDLAEETTNDDELSVRGSAVPMEKKPRPPTMTERDLTRGLTARSVQSSLKNYRK